MRVKKREKAASPGQRETMKPGNMLYPVPVVMVSCARPGERPNIITVAWTGTVCSDPAMLSISVRPERYSYGILKEFREMGLAPLASQNVAPPGIAQSPVCLECRVAQAIPLGSHHLFLSEIVGVTVDGRYMDEKGKFRLNDSGLISYSHGEYFMLGEKKGSFGYSVRKKAQK